MASSIALPDGVEILHLTASWTGGPPPIGPVPEFEPTGTLNFEDIDGGGPEDVDNLHLKHRISPILPCAESGARRSVPRRQKARTRAGKSLRWLARRFPVPRPPRSWENDRSNRFRSRMRGKGGRSFVYSRFAGFLAPLGERCHGFWFALMRKCNV